MKSLRSSFVQSRRCRVAALTTLYVFIHYAAVAQDSAAATAKAMNRKIAEAKHEVSTAPSSPDRFPDRWYELGANGPNMLAPVTGQPYSAVEVTTYRDKMADGTIATHDQLVTKMRDSAGRERMEDISGRGGSNSEGSYDIKSVQVSDPVSHCVFHWSEKVNTTRPQQQYEIAIVSCAPRTVTRLALDIEQTVIELAVSNDSSTVERVGGSFNGLNYIGIRVTPLGTEWTNRTETWYSPELHIILRQAFKEGAPDETDVALTDLRREEPDASLFYPPAGWKILTDQELKAQH